MSDTPSIEQAPATLLEQCPECQYDLRGGLASRCSECGLDLAFINSPQSNIPWCNAEVGWITGFCRTAVMAFFRPARIARELYRPVDYRAAQRFRLLCVLLGFLGLLPGLFVMERDYNPSEMAGGWFTLFLLGCVLLLLLFLSGVHTYLFHPRRLTPAHQNRALALSYYSSVNLLWLPLVSILAIANLTWLELDTDGALLILLGGYVLVLLLVLRLNALYARRLLGGSMLWVAFLNSMQLVAIHCLCLGLLPLVGLYVAMMLYSMLPLPTP